MKPQIREERFNMSILTLAFIIAGVSLITTVFVLAFLRGADIDATDTYEKGE